MNEEEAITFQGLFLTRLKERGFTLRKLSDATGIAVKHLEYLSTGQYDRLPPAPYLRGYLLTLGGLLGFDGEAWWERLKREEVIQGAGSLDRLPENRFAKKTKVGLGLLAALAVFTVLAAYFGLRFRAVFGLPTLTVVSPQEEVAVVREVSFLLRGTLANATELHVNNEPVEFTEHGTWEKEIMLLPGVNVVELTARKFLGGEVSVVKRLVYEPQPAAVEVPATSPQALPTAPQGERLQ